MHMKFGILISVQNQSKNVNKQQSYSNHFVHEAEKSNHYYYLCAYAYQERTFLSVFSYTTR